MLVAVCCLSTSLIGGSCSVMWSQLHCGASADNAFPPPHFPFHRTDWPSKNKSEWDRWRANLFWNQQGVRHKKVRRPHKTCVLWRWQHQHRLPACGYPPAFRLCSTEEPPWQNRYQLRCVDSLGNDFPAIRLQLQFPASEEGANEQNWNQLQQHFLHFYDGDRSRECG